MEKRWSSGLGVFRILSFDDSRKVGFGAWLFVMANVWLGVKRIDGNVWAWAVSASAVLIGGGTLLDKFLSRPIPQNRAKPK